MKKAKEYVVLLRYTNKLHLLRLIGYYPLKGEIQFYIVHEYYNKELEQFYKRVYNYKGKEVEQATKHYNLIEKYLSTESIQYRKP